MSAEHISAILTATVDKLSRHESYKGLMLQHQDGEELPSNRVLQEIVELARSILFPGYFGQSALNRFTINYHIGTSTERLFSLLCGQIASGLCFAGEGDGELLNRTEREAKAESIACRFIERLPYLRSILATDVEAAYNGDPAATSFGEIICCYPVIRALTNYRVAHELLLLGVPLIPRMITEMAHSETGIDIHPAATIGTHFTIDHGTGVVIGATCIIGNRVKLYQGVTLGAKSFPLDEQGHPIKGIPRHPILEDDVIVYSNATVLGRITLAKGTVIGGNLWVTQSTQPGQILVQFQREKKDAI